MNRELRLSIEVQAADAAYAASWDSPTEEKCWQRVQRAEAALQAHAAAEQAAEDSERAAAALAARAIQPRVIKRVRALS